jgi:REP element-mobilizing transposase RayT
MSDLPKRKHPAHPAPVERYNESVVIFVTLAVRPRMAVLANPAFLAAFRAALLDADAWRVSSYMLMPDHAHLFAVPHRLLRVGIAIWSAFLKRRITEHFGLHPEWDWLPGCWDTQMRTRDNYEEKRSYMQMNPVRAGLAATTADWPWRGEGAAILW